MLAVWEICIILWFNITYSNLCITFLQLHSNGQSTWQAVIIYNKQL
jgi:hypothetical protein